MTKFVQVQSNIFILFLFKVSSRFALILVSNLFKSNLGQVHDSPLELFIDFKRLYFGKNLKLFGSPTMQCPSLPLQQWKDGFS